MRYLNSIDILQFMSSCYIDVDLARKVEEIKMRKKAERQQQREAIRRAKQVRGQLVHVYHTGLLLKICKQMCTTT